MLKPNLWNVSYGSLLRLDPARELRLISHVDHVTALIAGSGIVQAQYRLNILMQRVSGMNAHCLNPAPKQPTNESWTEILSNAGYTSIVSFLCMYGNVGFTGGVSLPHCLQTS